MPHVIVSAKIERNGTYVMRCGVCQSRLILQSHITNRDWNEKILIFERRGCENAQDRERVPDQT